VSSEFTSALGPFEERAGGPSTDSIRLVGGGHAERIEALFKEEHPRVVAYLVARTGSWAEARDVAAHAFAKMLEMRDLGGVNSPKAYLYTVAQNIVKDRKKLSAIRRRIDQSVLYEMTTSFPSPEPFAVAEERLRILSMAMEGLRPLWREALTLRYWDHLEVAEMVARFAQKGIDVNKRTVERWLHDAIAECRRRVRVAEGEENGV
jgi:RNA polymerase sigma factor (sigma-70 family)